MMVRDEYDALLDESFGSDVDWDAIYGMNGATGLNSDAARAEATTESDGYFGSDLDESFLEEVRRIEEQAVAEAAPFNTRRHAVAGLAALPSAAVSLSRPFQPTSGTSRQDVAGTASAIASSSRYQQPAVTGLRLHTPQSIHPTYLLELPPVTSTATKTDSNKSSSTAQSKASPHPVTPKRPRLPISDGAAFRKKVKYFARQKTSKFLETIENVLQCPICFDIIAAPHLLSCGHSACGLCLNEWTRIRGHRTCCICRTQHIGALIPNYALDGMIALYFDQKVYVDSGESGDRKQWEKRTAEGKATLQAAARARVQEMTIMAANIRRLAPSHITPLYNYGPNREHDYEYEDIALLDEPYF